MPKVSVIVPNYNHKNYLEERLHSVFNQTFQDFEVILLDDCSSDESGKILEGYKDHPKVSHVVLNQTNSGSPFKQWFKGFELAKAEYIWIAESDDAADPRFLEVLIPKLDGDPNASLVYCQSYRTNEQSEITGTWNDWTEDIEPGRWKSDFNSDGIREIKGALYYKNTIPNASAVVFRKSAINSNSHVSKNFRLNGDWLFWISLLLKGSVIFTAEHLNYFRTHPKSVRDSTETRRLLKELLEFNKAMRSWVDLPSKSKKRADKNLVRAWWLVIGFVSGRDMFKSDNFYFIGSGFKVGFFLGWTFLRMYLQKWIMIIFRIPASKETKNTLKR